MKNQQNSHQKIWLGIFLVSLGGYFLLRNFDLIPQMIPHYFFGWEGIFVLIGGSMLLTGKREGLVFLAIGGFFLLNDIFYWPQFRIRDWWPVILIAIGLATLLRRRNINAKGSSDQDDDYFDNTNIFGGTQKNISSQNFKGGRITSIFGGSEISLANVQLNDGEVVVDVFCMFGGSSIIVPRDWTIINDSFVIFGGIEDQRPRSSVEEQDPKKILRIKGSVIFGGAEIKSA
ncbi:MAG: hypothetical protein JXR07_16530 [Reichenbachiella sp.]